MKPSPLRIRERIRILGVNPYAPVGVEAASRLKENWRGPMPVRYRVNDRAGRTWRINMMPVGDGGYRLYLNGEVRGASKLVVGEEVLLYIEFDDEYRRGPQHPMPSWFSGELARDAEARRGWDELPPSRQKEILRYFAGLKSEEAKQRNLRKALHVLSGGRGRFMARTWNSQRDGAAGR